MIEEFTPDELGKMMKALTHSVEKEEGLLPLRSSPIQIVEKAFFAPLEEGESSPTFSPWNDLPVDIEVTLGTTTLTLREISLLQPGDHLLLDQLAEEPLDIYVNGKKMWKGEVVVVERHYGIKILALEETLPFS